MPDYIEMQMRVNREKKKAIALCSQPGEWGRGGGEGGGLIRKGRDSFLEQRLVIEPNSNKSRVTPRLVSFRGLIQIFPRASPTFSNWNSPGVLNAKGNCPSVLCTKRERVKETAEEGLSSEAHARCA